MSTAIPARASSSHAGDVPHASEDGADQPAPLRAVYESTGQYPVHVVRENGLPDVALTVFANDLRRILSVSSVRGYVREASRPLPTPRSV